MSDGDENIVRSSRRVSARLKQFGHEECDGEDSSTATVGGKRHRRETLPDIAKRIPLDRLRPCLHLSLVNAAKELGISATTLKRLCRLYGIKRWPYRQIAGVDRTVERLETELQTSKGFLPRTMRESMTTHIYQLRLHREGMVELALEGDHDPTRGKLVCTGDLVTDIQVDSSRRVDRSVVMGVVAGGDRVPSSPVGDKPSSAYATTKTRSPATRDQITPDSCGNVNKAYQHSDFGPDVLLPTAVGLSMLPGATAASGSACQSPASPETELATMEASTTSANGRSLRNVSTTSAVLPPARSFLREAFAFGADLVGGQARSVVGASSLWSGHLPSSSVGKDRTGVRSGNGSELNYISQPRVAAPGLSLPSPARFHFGHRYKCNNQHEPRSVCQVPIDLPQHWSFGGPGLSTTETCVNQEDTRYLVGPRSELEASVGAKDDQYRGVGQSTDFNSEDAPDLGELMFDSSDGYDPGTDGW